MSIKRDTQNNLRIAARRFIGTCVAILLCTSVAPGDGGAPGAPGSPQCKDCEALQGCFRLLDPEGGNRERRAELECVLCGSNGKLAMSSVIPVPPPGVNSLAYCVLKFLGGPGLVTFDNPEDFAEPQMHWANGDSEYRYVQDVGLMHNSNPDGARWFGAYLGSETWRYEGTDGSLWEFDHVLGDTTHFWPISVSFWDQPEEGAEFTWGYLDAGTGPDDSELLDLDDAGMPSSPDPSNFRLKSISDGVVEYRFEYGAGSNPSGAATGAYSDEIRTVTMYVNGQPYSQVVASFYGSSSTCMSETTGGMENKRQSLTFNRYVNSSWVPMAHETYTWHVTGTAMGNPACIFRTEADILRSAYVTTGTPCESDLKPLASECREYNGSGQLIKVTKGHACCGG